MIKQVTESDRVFFQNRIDALEKYWHGQFAEVTTEITVFKTLLKRAEDDSRRQMDDLKKGQDALKEASERDSLAVLERLNKICDAFDIDGSKNSLDQARENLKWVNKKRKDTEQTWDDIRKDSIKWAYRSLIALVVSSMVLYINHYFESVNSKHKSSYSITREIK